MSVQILLLIEPGATNIALEWFVSRVNSLVIDQLQVTSKVLTTNFTQPWPLIAMH